MLAVIRAPDTLVFLEATSAGDNDGQIDVDVGGHWDICLGDGGG